MATSLRNAVIAGVIFLFSILGWVGWRFFGDMGRPGLPERAVATRMLAEELKKTHPAGPVLVISNPFSKTSGHPPEVYAYERAAIEGLRRGFGAGTELKIVFPPLKPEVLKNPRSIYVDPESTTPLSFLMAENAFDELVRGHSECQLAISLIGMPVNIGKMESWTKPGPPSFALLLPDWRTIGNREAVRAAFIEGKLEAAVVAKPGAREVTLANEGLLSDRFLVVTKSNFETLAGQFPTLFLR